MTRPDPQPSPADVLHRRVAELEAQLREAEETLDAIRNGEVDAVIVGGPEAQRVYTIENADRPYRVLIEQMQEGAVTLSPDATVLYCNRHLTTLLEMPQERVTGSSFLQFLPDAQRDSFDRLIRDSGQGGGKGEFALRTGDGRVVPVYLSFVDLPGEGERVLCGIVTDLTRQAQQRLAEEGLQVALDASEMGSWDLDLVTDTAHRSVRHDEIFGHGDADLGWGREVFAAYVLAEDRPAVAAAFAAALSSGALEFECRIQRGGDRQTRWVRVKGRTYYEDEVPVRMVGVVADITDQRQLEDQLRQAQKMEAVGQLTGGLAHDFNNLLTVILGNLEQAQAQVSDERLARRIGHAREAAERGAGLTQQLLAFSRRQSLQPRAICVNDLLPGLGTLIQRAIGEEVELQMVEGEGLWHCEADPNQLESAVLNLAINARDAMPQGGRLTIRSANIVLTEDGTRDRPGLSPGRFVKLSVVDTGEGMSGEVLARVFEPFFTTKDVGKGSGLGLSMVYGFARQSNGHVEIESDVGRGTGVHLYLPWAAAPVAEPAQAPAPSERPFRAAAVLVVEDDPDVRRLAVQFVADLGHAVFEAENGRDALVLLDGQPGVELLFTDIVMPKGMSGIDLAHEARRRRPGLAVLLTSGFTTQSMAEEEGSGRVFRLVRKPYRLDELAQALQEALADVERPAAVPAQPAGSRSLAGLRVFVAEDEVLISMVLEDCLADLGCLVVGPYARLDAALAGAASDAFDVALLDVNLVGGAVYPLAETLDARGVPFAFMTGYDSRSLPRRAAQNLAKPYTADDVRRVMTALLAQAFPAP